MRVLKISRKYFSKFFYPHFEYFQRCYASQEKVSQWKSKIGLEIHAQIHVESKLFSSGSSKYGLPTNSGVNLFDAAIPGTLPVLNKKAVELAVFAALALKCDVNPVSLFDRKHYFYADLPNGYQITQQRAPLAQNGSVDFAIFSPGVHKTPYYKSSKIKQIQLEQDSGKSYHEPGLKESFIDLNRAGIPLMEIVFEPDLDDAEEAGALVKELCLILGATGSCSCKMEEGALRVDVNVSVHEEGKELGVRTEIKNIGSIRGVVNAINYEVKRQLEVIGKGGKVSNQTLAWNPVKNQTVLMRDKEGHHDYRFMPEPNLPPLRIITNDTSKNYHSDVKDKASILDLRGLNNKIPKLPQEKRKTMLEKYGASDLIAYNIVVYEKMKESYEVDKLTMISRFRLSLLKANIVHVVMLLSEMICFLFQNIPGFYEYFIDIMTEDPSRNVKSVYHTLMVLVLSALNNCNMDINKCSFSSSHLGELADMRGKIINDTVGKLILEKMLKGSKLSPREIVQEEDLALLPEEKVREICLQVIENNPKEVKSYLKGKKKVMNIFVKDVVALSKSKVISSTAERLMAELLEEKRKTTHEVS